MIPEPQLDNLRTLFLNNILNGGTGSSFHLYTNNVLQAPTVELTDLVEATFDGYTPPTALTDWIAGIEPTTGRPCVVRTGSTIFACTGLTDLPQTVYGFYVLSSTGLLAAWEPLPVPLTVGVIGAIVDPDSFIVWNDSFQDQPPNV